MLFRSRPGLLTEFRQRQHHEQTYRVLLRDLFVDTAPSGYVKTSPNVRRPGFRQNALTLFAWIVALAAHALDDLGQVLPRRGRSVHPRTLRRWLLGVPADLYLAPDVLHVVLQPHRLRPVWATLIARANRHPVRIPWLNDRRLILSLDPPDG